MTDTNTNPQPKSVEELYLSGDLEAAIDLALSQKSQMEPGHFHYNLGSLYLKKGDLGAARLNLEKAIHCLLYTSPSPRDQRGSRMPSSA